MVRGQDDHQPVHTLGERVARLEQQREVFATREWVRTLIADTIGPIGTSIIQMQATQQDLSEQADSLFAAHNELLRERSQREKEEYNAKIKHLETVAESRTWRATIIRWAAVGAAIITLIGVLKLIDVLFIQIAARYAR